MTEEIQGQDAPTGTEMVAGDDRVIGVALRWSAVAVVFIVAIVVTVILLQGKEEEAAPVV